MKLVTDWSSNQWSLIMFQDIRFSFKYHIVIYYRVPECVVFEIFALKKRKILFSHEEYPLNLSRDVLWNEKIKISFFHFARCQSYNVCFSSKTGDNAQKNSFARTLGKYIYLCITYVFTYVLNEDKRETNFEVSPGRGGCCSLATF